MKDTSSVATSTGSGSDLRCRRLTRSMTTTRGSSRTRSCTCRGAEHAQRRCAQRLATATRLAVSDVYAVHPRGAALEQAVGEAAGGEARVQRHSAGDVDAERVQRSLQLVACAADEPARAGRVRLAREPARARRTLGRRL